MSNKNIKIVIILAICGSIFLLSSDNDIEEFKNITFGELNKINIILGHEDSSEVNINHLKIGPRGWIFGSTEENGWMFIVDPKNLEFVSWNVGREEPLSGQQFEGDITDFIVYEEEGALIILVCQANPAEISRYIVDIPENGLPNMINQRGEVVYQNNQWGRVMTIGLGELNKKKIIIAGSFKGAELICSVDGGLSWNMINYFDGDSDLDSARHKGKLTQASAFANINYINDTWFAFLYHAFLLESEIPWDSGYRHFVNGILYSRDGGITWKIAEVESNSHLPEELRWKIENDSIKNRLHPKLYSLVGEVAESLVKLEDGRLVINTGMDNFPEKPFGGRILVSDDNGQTWKETFNFYKYTDLSLASLRNNILLVGTMTKRHSADPNFIASGDIWISKDGGVQFSLLKNIIKTGKKCSFRNIDNLYVAGVSALVSTDKFVFIGTVNEGEKAELFYLQVE